MTPEARQHREAVWRVRANRLAKHPVADEGGQAALPVIVLGIEAERYAIDLPDVAEVLPPVRITPVPGAAAAIAGVINVHGQIRPVIDLRRLLGLGPDAGMTGRAEPGRVVLLRREGREMGLLIDSVGKIVWIDPADVESEGNGNTGSPGCVLSKYIRRSTKDLLMVLSTEALYAELEKGVTDMSDIGSRP